MVWRDQTGPHRIADQAGNMANAEPVHKLTAMGFDGLGAEMQEAGNLLGGMPFGNQLEDFALADGQRSWRKAQVRF